MAISFADLRNMVDDVKHEVDRLDQLRQDAYKLALLCHAAISEARSMHEYAAASVDIPTLEQHADAVLEYFNNTIAVVDNDCRHRGRS